MPPQPSNLLGIDLGSSGAKAVLATPDGEVLAESNSPYDTISSASGRTEQVPDVWWRAVRQVVRAVLDQVPNGAETVAAVACSGLGPCLVLLDRKGQPVRPAILYGIDSRAEAQRNRLLQRLRDRSFSTQILEEFTTDALLPKLLWVREHEPYAWAKTHKVLDAVGYLTWRLSGVQVQDHVQAQYWYPLAGVDGRAWNTEFCSLFDVPAGWLPLLVRPGQVISRMTPIAAQETGLQPDTPVVAGAVDTLADLLRSGAGESDELCILYGSTLCLARPVRGKRPHNLGLGVLGDLQPDRWWLGGWMTTAGSLLEWYLLTLLQVSTAEERLEIRTQAAAIPPGSDGLLVLPYWSGERTGVVDSDARGVIYGLTLTHTRAHVYRALLESLAYAMRQHLELLEIARHPVASARALGGGANNDLWTQIVSDVTGLRQVVLKNPATALGAAWLAGYGIGTLSPSNSWQEPERVVRPRINLTPQYAESYRSFCRLYPAMARAG